MSETPERWSAGTAHPDMWVDPDHDPRDTGAVLRNETSDGKFSTLRVWEHQPRVSGRSYECLVVEGEIQGAAGRQSLKTWFAHGLPLGALKIETGSTTVSLIDQGDDWAQRPAFPK